MQSAKEAKKKKLYKGPKIDQAPTRAGVEVGRRMKLKCRTRTIIVFPIGKSINTPLAEVSITCAMATAVHGSTVYGVFAVDFDVLQFSE